MCLLDYLINSYLSFCFVARFAFVLQMLWTMPILLKLRISKGSPSGRAPAIAGERVISSQFFPLRRLRRHLSQRARLFIISQIGRENNISADFTCVLRTFEDAGPYNCRPPYEKKRKPCRFLFTFSDTYTPCPFARPSQPAPRRSVPRGRNRRLCRAIPLPCRIRRR